jgi:hypothetical protein
MDELTFRSVLQLAGIEEGVLHQELALHEYGFVPRRVTGGDEVFEKNGELFTRTAALEWIRCAVVVGEGLPFPEGWRS